MKHLLTHLTAAMIVLASCVYRPQRVPLAEPFDAVEMRIDDYLKGLLQRG
jgi:hypothetical protein